MPQSLIDLAGLRVGAEEFLAAVLGATKQPIWVVPDPDRPGKFKRVKVKVAAEAAPVS